MSRSQRNAFIGSWRIVWMDSWDQDFVDMEVPGHFTFEKNNLGHFQFGLAQGEMDCRLDSNRVDFTWSGNDECDEASGRGWAETADDELHGHIYFHLGDDSAFRAVRQQKKSA